MSDIKQCYVQTFAEVLQGYWDNVLSRGHIFRWFKPFSEGRTISWRLTLQQMACNFCILIVTWQSEWSEKRWIWDTPQYIRFDKMDTTSWQYVPYSNLSSYDFFFCIPKIKNPLWRTSFWDFRKQYNQVMTFWASQFQYFCEEWKNHPQQSVASQEL